MTTDDELRAWLPKLAEWKLELGLEGGCVKPWGVTGKEASDFVIEKLTK